MSKDDFISGTILEFKVPLDIGYAYCKILDFRYIRKFDGVLIKVFDYIVKTPLDDITELASKELLFGARRMPDLPGTRGKGAWKNKGVLISDDDNLIPDFKYCIKGAAFLEDESKVGPWDAVKNINNHLTSSYEKIRHLEDTIVSPRLAIEIRTGMEYYRINNIRIDKKFDMTRTINDLVYKQMINVPIYRDIPKEIRGRALN